MSVVDVQGTLQAPVGYELSDRVESLLRRGERRIVLNLAQLKDIDAAGLGELVHVFNVTNAAGASLQIDDAPRHVRRLLRVTGLERVLRGGDPPKPPKRH